jgi:hypothetical protein
MKGFEEMLQGNQPDRQPVPSCQQCEKEGWKAIFTCLERPSGHCPYIDEWRKDETAGIVNLEELPLSGLYLFIGMLICFAPCICLVFLPQLFPPGWESKMWIYSIPVVVLLFFMLATPLTKVQLHHPGSGIRLQRITLGNIELSRTWLTKEEPIPVEMGFAQQLLYPPSVTALAAGQSGAAILRATLIGLLAQKYVQIYHYQSCRRKTGSIRPTIQDQYMIIATQRADQPQVAGELEKRIVQVLANASASKEAKEWPKVPPIVHLVSAIYDSDENNPEKWLTELVTRNAVNQGWGEMTGTWRKQFTWNIIAADHIRPEYQIIQMLTDQLANSHPELLRTFDQQIKMGIASRQDDRSFVNWN